MGLHLFHLCPMIPPRIVHLALTTASPYRVSLQDCLGKRSLKTSSSCQPMSCPVVIDALNLFMGPCSTLRCLKRSARRSIADLYCVAFSVTLASFVRISPMPFMNSSND